MRVGTGLPNVGLPRLTARQVSAYAQECEQSGFDSLWGGDRLFVPLQVSTPYPGGAEQWDAIAEEAASNMDPFTVAAAAMAGTDRIRFSWSTLNAPTYQPVHLARAITSLDVLSEGRLDCGFGMGWMKDEFDTVGASWAQRGELLDDILSFLQVWWTADPITYQSPFISLPASYPALRPVQEGGPAIYLAGLSAPAMRRVGRRAKGWFTLDGLPPDYLDSLWSTARRAAEEAGRDPDALERVVRMNAAPGESADSIAKRLAEMEESGADEAIIDFLFLPLDLSERLDLAQQVLASYRS